MFASLSVAGVLADGTATNETREWSYGPYDQFHRDPPLTQKNETPIILSPPRASGQILIYRGTQPDIVEPTTTNTIAPTSVASSDTMSWDSHASLKSSATIPALNVLANNDTTDRAERARAVFTLFANYVKPGDAPAKVHGILTDARWLEHANLYGVYALDGWIPVETSFEDTVFCLHLFADEKGWSNWVIYFRLTGSPHWQKEDALAFLRGKSVSGSPKIVEFALCFPGRRIERFSARGIYVYDSR
jgi:hypothetical protein